MIARSLVHRRDVCTHASHGVEDPASRKNVGTSLVTRRVTLVIAFGFLVQNFGKAAGTYKLYFVSL